MWQILLLTASTASYIPGIQRRSFRKGEKIDITVNKLDSSQTQLPFDYYFLNFCKPTTQSFGYGNIGQVLTGDRMEMLPYSISMWEEGECLELCSMSNSGTDMKDFQWIIDNHYKASWTLDGLPAGQRFSMVRVGEEAVRASYYQDGFQIGVKSEGEYYIYNHMNIIIQTYQESEDSFLIVGFLVEPLSLDNESSLMCTTHDFLQYLSRSKDLKEIDIQFSEPPEKDLYSANFLPPQRLQKNVKYSYSVIFEDSETKWTSRWDKYLYKSESNSQVHWISIINSFALVLLLSGMVAHITMQRVNREIRTYNDQGILDPSSDSGWKQIRGDVFRAPPRAGLFAILIGSGTQLIAISFLLLVFTCLGFLSPEYRGGLITATLFLFAFFGFLSGYVAARLYKLFGGIHWKSNAVGTALFFPGICFSVFFTINLVLWAEQSSGAIPFWNLLTLLMLWFGISVPLVFMGHAIGYKKTAIETPCKMSSIPRPLLHSTDSLPFIILSIAAGSLPFGSMFIELSYVMNTLWHHTLIYYLFGFLLLCFCVVLMTSAEVSILMTYMLICKEDYRWWWTSLGVSASSGLYMLGYSIVYFIKDLEMTRFSSSVLYFGYMLLSSLTYSLITGTIGFIATFIFIRSIYSQIKID